jgi:hypothetical protein
MWIDINYKADIKANDIQSVHYQIPNTEIHPLARVQIALKYA